MELPDILPSLPKKPKSSIRMVLPACPTGAQPLSQQRDRTIGLPHVGLESLVLDPEGRPIDVKENRLQGAGDPFHGQWQDFVCPGSIPPIVHECRGEDPDALNSPDGRGF